MQPAGYPLKKCLFQNDNLLKIRRDLTVAPSDSYIGTPVEPYCVFAEDAERIYLPRAYALDLIKSGSLIVDARDSPFSTTPECIDVDFSGHLKPEQEAPAAAFLQQPSGILSLPCGFGKTTIAIYIMCHLRQKVLIVVHKECLLRQWQERIGQFAPSARMGILRGKTQEIHNKDVVITLVQSLQSNEYDLASFGLVVVDEVHHMAARTFSHALRRLSHVPNQLGLSATVDRRDGLTRVFLWHMGPVLYSATRESEGVTVWAYKVAYPAAEYATVPQYVVDGKRVINVSRLVTNICGFEQRTSDIAAVIAKVFNDSGSSRRILVLSDRRSHLNAMGVLLADAGIKIGYLMGGMRPHEVAESKDAHVMLATYNFASEGFDAPLLDTLVLATSKTDVEQSIGRILRIGSASAAKSKNAPLVIDVIDSHGVFQHQAKKRAKYYKTRDYRVVCNQPSAAGGVDNQPSTSTVIKLDDLVTWL